MYYLEVTDAENSTIRQSVLGVNSDIYGVTVNITATSLEVVDTDGGLGPYTYQWYSNSSRTILIGSTSLVSSLSPGTRYWLTTTDYAGQHHYSDYTTSAPEPFTASFWIDHGGAAQIGLQINGTYPTGNVSQSWTISGGATMEGYGASTTTNHSQANPIGVLSTGTWTITCVATELVAPFRTQTVSWTHN